MSIHEEEVAHETENWYATFSQQSFADPKRKETPELNRPAYLDLKSEQAKTCRSFASSTTDHTVSALYSEFWCFFCQSSDARPATHRSVEY
jgi:hypothetical protein